MANTKSLWAKLFASGDESLSDAELHQKATEQIDALKAENDALKAEVETAKAEQAEDLSPRVAELESEVEALKAEVETATELATDMEAKYNAEVTARAGAELQRDEAIQAKKEAEAIVAKKVADAINPPNPDTGAGDGETLGAAIDKSIKANGRMSATFKVTPK